MALVSRAFRNRIFDPSFTSSSFEPFESLPLLDRTLPSFCGDVSTVASTPVGWVKTPGAHVCFPGMRMEDTKVQVVDTGFLSISREYGIEEVKEKDSYREVERSSGKFHRHFKLPINAKVQGLSAKVENGVLKVAKVEVTKKTLKWGDVEIPG